MESAQGCGHVLSFFFENFLFFKVKGQMSATHGEPPEVLLSLFCIIASFLFIRFFSKQGLECMVTFEEITKDNFCEYQTVPSGLWHPSKFASGVVRRKKSEIFLFVSFDEMYGQQLLQLIAQL